MKRRFHNTEDVFSKVKKNIDTKDQKLFLKIDIIEQRMLNNAEEKRLKNLKITTETLRDARLLTIC